MRTRLSLRLLALALSLALGAGAAGAATIVIVNVDGPGEGFNDPTAAAPVGGNNGMTVGAQRLNVFNHAASVWGAILPSAVTIRIEASFDPLTCGATSAVLGSAGTIDIVSGFPNQPIANTWYHVALANRLAGMDLVPASNDIDATFNSNLNGNPGCLGGVGWYYGFDGNEGGNVDLLPVVLHEMGHGLGFSTFTTLSTGAFPSNRPDIYSRFIFDITTGLLWPAMSNAQRAASAINTGNVVWNGSTVTASSPMVLAPRSVVVVNSPGAIAGTYTAGGATFGGNLTSVGLTGNVVLANDGVAPTSDACTPLVNGAQITGNIAFIDRGTCTFAAKALAAQNAGATGVIIANNVAGVFAPGGSDPAVTIPVLGISLADGNTIRAQLGAGVNVTMRIDFAQDAGADAQGRVQLYTPNPLQTGSSVSHFDVLATPNLLMEPAINPDLPAGGVDLTRALFQDIGWFQGVTDAMVPSYTTRIHGNYPNPFNPTTTVRFELELDGPVRLAVYDAAGRLVKRLAGGHMTAGTHGVTWDGKDAAGNRVANGVYIARLEAVGMSATHRMVLLK